MIDLSEYDLTKLTDEELILINSLLDEAKIDAKLEGLKNITPETPKNYAYLVNNYNEIKYEGDKLISGKKGIILEGGARSRKTYSFIDFLVYLCLYKVNNKTIIILRDTYNSFHTTLFTDLETALDEFRLKNPFKTSQQVTQLKIRNNRIHFKGADNPNNAAGAPSFLLYFNEMLPIPKDIIMNYIMRCSGMWVGDFNPSVTEHWVFNKLIPRPDVGHLRTTFKDNPLCPVGMKIEIMGYEPWLPGSYEIKNDTLYYNDKLIDSKNQPPPHPENAKNGTADVFMWKVYGLGLRGAMQGVIFENVEYIDEFPEEMAFSYGLDFGFTTDPCTLVKSAEDDKNIWIELLCYEPIETPEEIDLFMEKIGCDKLIPITADSSDKYTGENKGTVEMVKGLRKFGWKISKVNKTKSVMYHLLSMKKKKIHIINNHLVKFAKVEQQNYKMKEIGGVFINQPIDAFNHMWDASRYRHMAFNKANNIYAPTTDLQKQGLNY